MLLLWYLSVVGWPWLDSRCPPSRSITPLLSWTGERKYNKRLVGQDKDREITQQLLLGAKQTQLGEISLIY